MNKIKSKMDRIHHREYTIPSFHPVHPFFILSILSELWFQARLPP